MERNYQCNDGGPGSITFKCALGHDCADCGPRTVPSSSNASPPPPSPAPSSPPSVASVAGVGGLQPALGASGALTCPDDAEGFCRPIDAALSSDSCLVRHEPWDTACPLPTLAPATFDCTLGGLLPDSGCFCLLCSPPPPPFVVSSPPPAVTTAPPPPEPAGASTSTSSTAETWRVIGIVAAVALALAAIWCFWSLRGVNAIVLELARSEDDAVDPGSAPRDVAVDAEAAAGRKRLQRAVEEAREQVEDLRVQEEVVESRREAATERLERAQDRLDRAGAA